MGLRHCDTEKQDWFWLENGTGVPCAGRNAHVTHVLRLVTSAQLVDRKTRVASSIDLHEHPIRMTPSQGHRSLGDHAKLGVIIDL